MSPYVSQLPRADLVHVMAHTCELWAEAQGGSLFVTGGTGFFGKWLLETFLFANDSLGLDAKMCVLTRDVGRFRREQADLAAHPAICLIEGDVRRFKFPPGNFDFVIHAATEASRRLNEESPMEMVDVIEGGTARVLAFAEVCGARKLLFTSSGAIYGPQPSDITHLSEDFTPAPDSLRTGSSYARGKRRAESLCSFHAQRTGMEIKIARCFAFVGPYLPLDAHFAIGNFLRDALHGGPIRIEGDGTPYRSYLYAADLMIWLWTILLKGVSMRPYNVGSDKALPIVRVAKSISEAFEPRPAVLIAKAREEYDPRCGEPPMNFSVTRYVPNVSRARGELGLDVWIDLRDSIRRTKAWHANKLSTVAL